MLLEAANAGADEGAGGWAAALRAALPARKLATAAEPAPTPTVQCLSPTENGLVEVSESV